MPYEECGMSLAWDSAVRGWVLRIRLVMEGLVWPPCGVGRQMGLAVQSATAAVIMIAMTSSKGISAGRAQLPCFVDAPFECRV